MLTCEGTVIPVQDELELLGVTPDSKLKFEGLMRKICRKVSQQVAVLNRLKKILPFELRTDIHRAFITLHFNYCSEPWHYCGKRSGSGKPKKINERALRFVTRDKSTMYETLVKQLNLMSPLNQIVVEMATGVYKAIHGLKSLKEWESYCMNDQLIMILEENTSSIASCPKYNHLWT